MELSLIKKISAFFVFAISFSSLGEDFYGHIAWIDKYDKKTSIEWENRVLGRWKVESGVVFPVYQTWIVLPPLLNLQLVNEDSHYEIMDGDKSPLKKKGEKVLYVESTKRSAIIPVYKKIGSFTETAKLVVDFQPVKQKIVYHQSCHKKLGKKFDLFLRSNTSKVIFVYCETRKEEEILTFFPEEVSSIEQVRGLPISLLSNNKEKKGIELKVASGKFPQTLEPVYIGTLNFPNNEQLKISLQKTTRANASFSIINESEKKNMKSRVQETYFSYGIGASKLGMAQDVKLKTSWSFFPGSFEYEWWHPFLYSMSQSEKRVYYYHSLKYQMEISSRLSIGAFYKTGKIKSGANRGFELPGLLISGNEYKFHSLPISFEMNLGIFDEDVINTSIDFDFRLFQNINNELSFFSKYEYLKKENVSYKEHLLTMGVRVKW